MPLRRRFGWAAERFLREDEGETGAETVSGRAVKVAGAAGTARPKRERTTREKVERVESRRREIEVRLIVEFLIPPDEPGCEDVEASTTIEWSPREVPERATWWCVAMWARRAIVE